MRAEILFYFDREKTLPQPQCYGMQFANSDLSYFVFVSFNLLMSDLLINES